MLFFIISDVRYKLKQTLAGSPKSCFDLGEAATNSGSTFSITERPS